MDAGETAQNKTGGATERPRVLVFYDYACPFCYIDQVRLARLAEEYDAELVLVPFELRPDMPDEGISASEHGLTHSERVEARLVEIAAEQGQPWVALDHIPKTHLAMVMAEVARDKGFEVHWRTHMAIFTAHYGTGADIGDRKVLLGIADEVGLDCAEVERSWADPAFDERLHQFGHLAMHLGVEQTPAALVCNELLIGSRPYGVLQAAIERCLVRPENVVKETGVENGLDAASSLPDERGAKGSEAVS